MMTSRKILCLALILTMVVAMFGGCAAKPANTPAGDKPAQENEEAKPSEEEAPADEPIELVWATWAISEEALKPIYMSMIDTYMADHPNVHIGTITYPYSQYMEQLLISVAGGNAPSFAHIKADWTRQLSDIGAQLNLNDIMSDELKADYYENVLAGATIDGNIVAAPWFNTPSAMFYNKTLLAEAGITTLPQTWDELIEDARRVAALGTDENGNKIYGIGIPNFKGEYGASFISLPFLWGNGGGIVDANGKIDVSSPNNAKAFAQIQQLFKDGVAPNGNSEVDSMNLFAQGLVGFLHQIQTATGTFASASPLGADFANEYGVMVIPGQDGPEGSGYMTEHYLMFFNTVPENAYEDVCGLIDHFSGAPVLQILYDAGMGKMPDRASVAEMPIFTTDADDITKVFVSALPTCRTVPVSDPNFITVDEYFIDTLTKLATTDDTPETIAAEFNDQVKALYQ